MKKKIIIANWKMNKNIDEARNFAKKFENSPFKKENEVVICPPFLLLDFLKIYSHKFGFELGAQNCFFEDSGAYTGEISALMLKNLGVKYVILGHSERRKYFFESNEVINKKLKSVIKNGLIPILCVGENLNCKEENGAEKFVLAQISECLNGIEHENFKNIIIAYEPIWAIGTGKNMSPEEADEMCGLIKNFILKKFGKFLFSKFKTIYGGSLNEKNFSEFFQTKNIDGGLIGGASLEFEKFKKIINY